MRALTYRFLGVSVIQSCFSSVIDLPVEISKTLIYLSS
jgi:hypothetical protein